MQTIRQGKKQKTWQGHIDKKGVLLYNGNMGYEKAFAEKESSRRGFMTKDIIKSIKQAEEQAQAMKDKALAEAETYVKQAEKLAVKEAETMKEVCRAYKNSQLKDAEKAAQESYVRALEAQREKSGDECSRILENSEAYVGLIVGRIIRGDR